MFGQESLKKAKGCRASNMCLLDQLHAKVLLPFFDFESLPV